ncbi:MAG: tRNA (adenosine(37)-N6)-threonylcarbamoyltransferase complex transferase subunit TsaD [Deltaproteobacteria bacterium]|jgi:N6-L-threonylcarbamoyladenine synthase|nr:tRNA (adenosine(37)-N6)-threonylcarbamoyltransferase complex transferase subunit TsaD [Deltaproteobacteria bacterium]
MLVLALESSCDETAAALVDGAVVYSETVRSQLDLHHIYGGVVPEIAGRAHLEAVEAIVGQVFADAGASLADVGGLAVTQGPGLVGALLVALSFAKGLSISARLPLTGVNHVQAHALAPFLREGENMKDSGSTPSGPELGFPLVALVVSGGHTNLFLVESPLRFQTLGRTLDDAAGEAFDKSAKLMGLGYPGGRVIEEMARQGDPDGYKLARPLWGKGLDFSFSGLKTQVMTVYRQENMDDEPADSQKLKDLAASFQAAVADVLVHKLEMAVSRHRVKSVVVAGGVAANGALREATLRRFAGLAVGLPKLSWCADNAAMIGYLGGLQLARNANILDLAAEAKPRWPIESLK